MSTTETSSIPSAFESRSSLAELVAARAAEQPGAIAVEDGERRLTYAELDLAATSVAAGLRAAGVGDQEVVGVCLPRSWQAVCAFVGVVRAGAAYVPVVPTHPAERRRALLELAGANTVLTAPATTAGCRPRCVPRCRSTGSFRRLRPGALRPGGDRLAYVLFTSGSTGVPKGVEITHATLAHVLASGSDLVPEPGDAVLGVAPTEFDISVLEMWGALAAGGRLVLVPPGRPDPRALGRLIAERQVTYAFFAAGLFEQVVHAALPDLAGMRLIAAGGDVMSPAAAKAILDAHPGVRVVNGYGPTETSIIASSFEVTSVDGSPLPIGRPLRGYEFHVLDEDGRPVVDGESGELWIGGPGVARGYRGDPERSADRFRPSPLATDPGARMYGSGDVVRRREDGEFQFLGRIDHQVKISGHRVEPGEVEQALGCHPEVRHAAVVAREDVAGHKRLVAFAAPCARVATRSARQLLDHLAERLPSYMLPATVEILAGAAADRRAARSTARPCRARRAHAARTRRPGRLGSSPRPWPSCSASTRSGPDEDFFAAGADSLLAIQLVGRLRGRFESGLGVDAIFESRTPRGLAARIDAGEGTGPGRPPLVATPVSGPTPVSFAQRRAWLFERMNPDSLAFQFACVLHLEGDLDEESLAAALGDLIARHEILRTGLVERDGEPVQIVAREVPLPLEVVDLPGESGAEWARLVRSRVRTRIAARAGAAGALDAGPAGGAALVADRRRAPRGPRRLVVHDLPLRAGRALLGPGRAAAAEPAAAARRSSATSPAGSAPALDPELERAQLDHWRRTPRSRSGPARPPPRPAPPPARVVRRRLGSARAATPALAADVRGLAREEGATSFMACLAAFAALLGRYADRDDVQIGSGLANRRDPAAERLVGMTVATVALRIDLSGDPTVRELLRRVRGAVLGAMANSDVPFEQVVEDAGPEPASRGRSPLVQTLFSFDDAPAGAPDAGPASRPRSCRPFPTEPPRPTST